MQPYSKSSDGAFFLFEGNSETELANLDLKFDLVFADPPYFLSNDGLTVHAGKIVSVNKAEWDKFKDLDSLNGFNLAWLSQVREKMQDDATLWISGTTHNIFSVGQALVQLGFKILNIITWQKSNPPPNFSCRTFTHSTEQIIWARKCPKVAHYFDYELMKRINDGKQMKDVWKLPAILPWEKSCGKHPTQKPLALLSRIILASSKPGAWVLDPFTGSSTTGIAANLYGRKFVGIDNNADYLNISRNRKIEIENPEIAAKYLKKLAKYNNTSLL